MDVGRRQLYIYWWDGENRLYPDLDDATVRDLIAQKRAEISKKNSPIVQDLQIHEFRNGEMWHIYNDLPSYA